MKKCIVISDSFKGSLPSRDICAIARERIPLFFPACEVRALNVADGGEGTVDCFLDSCGGERVLVSGVQDPYGEPIDAAYGLLPDGTAVIEMAAAAGLPLVAGRKNPCVTQPTASDSSSPTRLCAARGASCSVSAAAPRTTAAAAAPRHWASASREARPSFPSARRSTASRTSTPPPRAKGCAAYA